MDRKLIPDVPEPLVLTAELEQKLQGWIAHFRNISPRVVVKTPLDKDFNLLSYENSCKSGLDYSDNPEDIKLCDWPKQNQVAFMLCFDSAMPGNKPDYRIEDAFIFCFKDFAFSLGRNSFEQGDRTNITGEKYAMEYCLYSDDERLLKWDFNKELIENRLIDIEKSVPNIT